MESLVLSFQVLLSTFFFFFFIILLKVWKKSESSYKPLNPPPGPWKLPLIGNLHQLVGSPPHHKIRDLAETYGPILRLQLGEVKTVVVSSHETAKEILKTHDTKFAQRPFMLAVNMLTYDGVDIVCSPYGDYWRQLRKICVLELLSSRRVKSFRSIREEKVSSLIRSLSCSSGRVVNLSEMLFSLSYSITATAAFGKKCKEPEEFIKAMQEVIRMAGAFTFAELFPSFKLLHVLNGMKPRIKKLRRSIDIGIDNVINEHKAVSKNIVFDEGEEHDLLDVLFYLQAHGNLEIPLTNNSIKAIMVDMFIGGTETSSIVVEWAMSELVRNPRVMLKAQAEVRQVFHSKGEVDETGLEELDYLKLVVKESLRLHPVIPMLIPRECREACQINGYDVPVNTRVFVNAWAIGRDPKYWNEAEKFYPERFLDCSKGANFEYLPFGAGRRVCPGVLFGSAVVELLLANLLYHFDWKLPSGMKREDLDMAEDLGGVVRRKNGLSLIPVSYQPE